MKVYRVGRSEYIQDLSGTGAKLYGGRWNDKGTALLYTSENISLAILEILVHFDGLTVPEDFKLLTLEIPDSQIIEYSKSKFKKVKMLSNAEYKFKSEGESWIKSQESLALKVPSIINEFEYNFIINPCHKLMSKVTILNLRDLELDERLFK